MDDSDGMGVQRGAGRSPAGFFWPLIATGEQSADGGWVIRGGRGSGFDLPKETRTDAPAQVRLVLVDEDGHTFACFCVEACCCCWEHKDRVLCYCKRVLPR